SQECCHSGTVKAPRARIAHCIAEERAEEREEIPQDEDAKTGRPKPSALLGTRELSGGRRSRLVDRDLRSKILAPAREPEHAVHLHAVDRVAYPEQRRGTAGGRAAASACKHPDERELRAAREHEQAERNGLPNVEPSSDGQRAEGDAVKACCDGDRQSDPDGR